MTHLGATRNGPALSELRTTAIVIGLEMRDQFSAILDGFDSSGELIELPDSFPEEAHFDQGAGRRFTEMFRYGFRGVLGRPVEVALFVLHILRSEGEGSKSSIATMLSQSSQGRAAVSDIMTS